MIFKDKFLMMKRHRSTVLSLLTALLCINMAWAVFAEDQPVGPDLLFAGPLCPDGAQFENLEPSNGATISNNQPTISARVFCSSDTINLNSIQMFIESCPFSDNRPYFRRDDVGVSFDNESVLDDEGQGTFSVDLEAVGCELPNEQITVTIEAETALDRINGTREWFFTVDVPNQPDPPSQPGPARFRIDSLAPTFAQAGGEVTVRGAGFKPAQSVSDFLGISHFFPGTDVIFNGAFLPADISNSGELSFEIPANTGCGSFPVQLFNRMVPLAPGFEFPEFSNIEFVQIQCLLVIPLIPASPELDRLEPSSGPIGTEVRVIGTGNPNTGFYENDEGEALSVVFFGGNPSSPGSGLQVDTTYIGDHELRFQVPDSFECDQSYFVQVRGPGQMITNPFYSNPLAFQVICEEEGGIEFSDPVPVPGLFGFDPGTLPLVSVDVTTSAPNASIVPGSLEMTIDQCPGVVFGVGAGAQFISNTFTVNLANVDFIDLPSPPCELSPNSSPTVTVVAEDSVGNEAEYSWTFNVLEQENFYEVELDYFPNNPRVTDEMTFTATLSMSNGNVVFFHWFLDDTPEEINDINNNGDAPNCNQPCTQVTWDDPTVGPHTMAVRISNNTEILGWTSVNFNVALANGNTPPIVTLTYEEVEPQNGAIYAVRFTAVASDPDGDFLNPLNYEWYANDLNDGIQGNFERLFNNSGNPVSGDEITVNFGSPDEYAFRVVVPDGNGGEGQAEVEITIPDGPSGSPSPSPSPRATPLHLALDLNGDGTFDDQEIQIAIAYWAKGDIVPESNATINDCLMKQLTEMWITGKSLSDFDPLKCGASTSSAVLMKPQQFSQQAKPVVLRATSTLTRQVRLQQPAEQIHLQVFDLKGRLIVDETSSGSALAFSLIGQNGAPLANGVYFYSVSTRGYDGQIWRSGIRKLILFR